VAVGSKCQREEVIGLKGSFRGSGCFGFGLLVDDRLSQFAKGGICVFLFFQGLIQKPGSIFMPQLFSPRLQRPAALYATARIL
jgi:hypothetical protein